MYEDMDLNGPANHPRESRRRGRGPNLPRDLHPEGMAHKTFATTTLFAFSAP